MPKQTNEDGYYCKMHEQCVILALKDASDRGGVKDIIASIPDRELLLPILTRQDEMLRRAKLLLEVAQLRVISQDDFKREAMQIVNTNQEILDLINEQ